MMWGWGNGWGNGWGAGEAVMIVFLLAVLALIVVGIVLLVRGVSRHDYSQPSPPPGHPTGPAGRSSLQILEERYARGEIDREEFLQRKQDLSGN